MFSLSRAGGPDLHQLEMFDPTQTEGSGFIFVLGCRSTSFPAPSRESRTAARPRERRAAVPRRCQPCPREHREGLLHRPRGCTAAAPRRASAGARPRLDQGFFSFLGVSVLLAAATLLIPPLRGPAQRNRPRRALGCAFVSEQNISWLLRLPGASRLSLFGSCLYFEPRDGSGGSWGGG